MAKENVTDDLRAELKTLADTLEEVLNSSADKSKEEIGKLRSKAESALKESRARLGETSDAICVKRARPPRGRMIMFAKSVDRSRDWCRRRAGAGCPAVASLIMANTQHTQGPGQRVFSIGQRIVTLLVEWWKHGCAWSSWSWRRRKPTSSSC